jgi:hypothetical protein
LDFWWSTGSRFGLLDQDSVGGRSIRSVNRMFHLHDGYYYKTIPIEPGTNASRNFSPDALWQRNLPSTVLVL